jgi:Uma2 family endonuclease
MGMAVAIPRYTVEDLETFPDDGNRYELLDGMLLVTPAAEVPHELILSRLRLILGQAVQGPKIGYVFGPGVVIRPPNTQLQPDMLIVPFNVRPRSKWIDLHDHWLAVEVLSPSSRVYDRNFKRDVYLTLGVREVWIVDGREQVVEVAKSPGKFETLRDELVWAVPDSDIRVTIDLAELFSDAD